MEYDRICCPVCEQRDIEIGEFTYNGFHRIIYCYECFSMWENRPIDISTHSRLNDYLENLGWIPRRGDPIDIKHVEFIKKD